MTYTKKINENNITIDMLFVNDAGVLATQRMFIDQVVKKAGSIQSLIL